MWTKEGVNLTSSFWHLTSAYSLERQETQIFLFLPLFFGSSLARVKVEDARFLAGTLAIAHHLLFHASIHCDEDSSKRLETAWRTIPRPRRPQKINHLNFLLLFTNVFTIYLQLWASKTTWKEGTNATRVWSRWRPCCEIRDTIVQSSYACSLTSESPDKVQNNRSEQYLSFVRYFWLTIVFFRWKFGKKWLLTNQIVPF